MDEFKPYLKLALRLGCTEEQVENFLTAGITLQYKQLAASGAARACDHPDGPTEVGFGGGRCGGKTFWMLCQMGLDDCQRVPNLKCLLLRKTAKSNLEHFEDLRRIIFRRTPHEFIVRNGEIIFRNGSRIIAKHFQHEKDLDDHIGIEYDVVGIEEATTLSPKKYSDISTCCRSSKLMPDGTPWRPRMYSTTNPGGVGHASYKERFIVPWQNGKETDTRFIQALLDDNQYSNKEYRQVLEKLKGWVRQAWLHGKWDIMDGQYFKNFRREVHVIDDFDDRRGVEWFASFDSGSRHYTVVLLACLDGDGNMFIVDEHAERMWLPEQHARAMNEMFNRHQVQCRQPPPPKEIIHAGIVFGYEPRLQGARYLSRFSAGSDVFSRQADGLTIAQQYLKHGIRMTQASMERVHGWAEILNRLGDPDRGIAPRLFIHKRCTRLINCLPTLQHDPNRPHAILKRDVDEDGAGGDDTADALRYLIATKPAPQILQRKLVGV